MSDHSKPVGWSLRPRIVVVSASMGAGHDGFAAELSRRASCEGYEVERLDFLDLLPLRLGHILRKLYWFQLMVVPVTWGWILPVLARGRGRGWAARLAARLSRRRLLAAVDGHTCLVLSTYPLASQALSEFRLSGELWCPAVTCLTDMSVHPLWIAPGVDEHLAIHELPAFQARALGARGVRVVGPIVATGFRTGSAGERESSRRALGLPSNRPLALVVSGSWGVGAVIRTVDDLLATGLVTPVVVGGTNRSLRRATARRPGAVALGWVADMPALMRACDVVVQNAGGLTLLEARQSGLPLVTYRCLPGHGVTNAEAMEAAGWASWPHERCELDDAVELALLGPKQVGRPGSIPWDQLTGIAVPVPA